MLIFSFHPVRDDDFDLVREVKPGDTLRLVVPASILKLYFKTK